MKLRIPDIPEAERTPLVVLLVDCIRQLEEENALLKDEIARLKGLKPRPEIKPSTLEASPPPPPGGDEGEGHKRPGSVKRAKTAHLSVHRVIPVLLPDPPEGAQKLKKVVEFVVQELICRVENIRYERELWKTADGQVRLAPLPTEVLPGSHFGPQLQAYILHQYHHQRVTQPLLLEQLRQLGVDISAGQLNRILTEGKDIFHHEKEAILQAGLETASYIQVDDTGARHQGQNGYCTSISNELFAYFESTDSKSRLNFLTILGKPHSDYVLNEVARAYWERQGLASAVRERLRAGPEVFANEGTWNERLAACGVTTERQVRIATEGALLGSLTEHGVSPTLVVLSDGAPQFDILVHAACWVHAERPLHRLIPYNEQHRTAIATIRQQIWELYQELKAYQAQPDPARTTELKTRLDALCAQRTGYPSIDQVLKDMAANQGDLLRVLERPEVPLHNNASESVIREYVTKRKISGSTRSSAGRRCRDTFASLKKTCRALHVNFWEYLQDRLRGRGLMPRLPDLIRQRAKEWCPGKVQAAPA